MNEPVLVLNRNFEPINVCNTQRAVGLLMVGKAELVENGRGYIRTAMSVFPRPSVIRLSYMIRRPRPRVKLTKREIFRRDDYTCQYCGQPSARPTVDHIIPRFRGGEYSWENLVTACPQCNRRKGGKTLQEAHMLLRRRPTEPQPTAKYLYGRQARDPERVEWHKYLEGW
jgi:5-methylcytosine-specific restriction endonuclease McrA